MDKTILIVDDEPINLSILANLFKTAYTVRACRSGEEALRVLKLQPKPDLILLDIMMPGLDGYATLDSIRKDEATSSIPVIFISALDSDLDEDRGFRLGAVDYITKPFKPAIVSARVNVHLELKQAKDRLENQKQWLESEVSRRLVENQFIQDAALFALTQLAETRDDITGNHIERTNKYVESLARALQKRPEYSSELDEATLNYIVKAAPLHDIGKIGIPDSILKKTGKLNEEEYEIIKSHCQIGASALRSAINRSMGENLQKNGYKAVSLLFMEQAETIALYHHEKWDGSGYPQGLRETQIPLSARLMALADVFDALTSWRPYKDAWPLMQAVDYIVGQKGIHFDPAVVDAFLEERDTFGRILLSMAD